MFGKEQPEVTTDDEVGDFVKSLQEEGMKELNNFITPAEEDDNGVAHSSRKPTSGAQNTE